MIENQHSPEYEAYMHSQKWIDRKRRIFKKRGRVCQMCGATSGLEVHHKDYTRLGHEIDDDLLIVCRDCHPKADAQRVEWEARRVAQVGIEWATLSDVERLTARLVQLGE